MYLLSMHQPCRMPEAGVNHLVILSCFRTVYVQSLDISIYQVSKRVPLLVFFFRLTSDVDIGSDQSGLL